VSIGIAFSNEIVPTATELIEQADHAMYRAKAAGRARWATGTLGGPRVMVGQGDVEWERLVQASKALTHATQLLEGNSGH
jgi:hypothetical protein